MIDDYADKLGTAEEYLLRYSPDSQEFEAALEHVLWVHGQPKYKRAAAALLTRVISHRSSEQRFTAVITSRLKDKL